MYFYCLRLFVVVYKLVNVGFDIRVVLCTSVPSVIVRNANLTKLEAYTLVYKFYCLRLFVVVYKHVNVVLSFEWYCAPVYQVS